MYLKKEKYIIHIDTVSPEGYIRRSYMVFSEARALGG